MASRESERSSSFGLPGKSITGAAHETGLAAWHRSASRKAVGPPFMAGRSSLPVARGRLHQLVLLHLLVQRDAADPQGGGGAGAAESVVRQGALDDAALQRLAVVQQRVGLRRRGRRRRDD